MRFHRDEHIAEIWFYFDPEKQNGVAVTFGKIIELFKIEGGVIEKVKTYQ